MGKLGKKARKFAKKNLQSVLKRKRKAKVLFKKRAFSRNEQNAADEDRDATELSNGSNPGVKDREEMSFDALFHEDDSDMAEDASGSDGYFSEESSFTNVAESDIENFVEEKIGQSVLLEQKSKLRMELDKKRKKMDKLKEKDSEFVKFLKGYEEGIDELEENEIYSDEDGTHVKAMHLSKENITGSKGKLLTSSLIKFWCQIAKEKHSVSAFRSLLNGYRSACHYGTESPIFDSVPCGRFKNSEAFTNIVTYMLHEADSIFCGLLGLKVPSSGQKKETILKLVNSSEGRTYKPLIRSYLRSTLFLLSQAPDTKILAFFLIRIRASVAFFSAFPSLLHRLIKIAVHLWATGEPALASCSFYLIRDIAAIYNYECFETCLRKIFNAYVAHCKFIEPAILGHIEFLRRSFVELCSLDVPKSSSRALLSIEHLAKIMQQGLQLKNKEAVKMICSWQYICCIDLWVMYISEYICNYDLQPLLFMTIQIINSIAYLFPGPRYLPLRLRCIRWLNSLSSSSKIFIPLASMVLDILEYNEKGGREPRKGVHLSSVLKLPKHWLKSQNFQKECALSAIEMLSVHFSQWSYHISFPELATVPLIRLRKFCDKTTIDGLRRAVKRFIDQVELNVEYVQKKRDEVSFSPKDQQTTESFLQLEKSARNDPFMQYYKSIIMNSEGRNHLMKEKISFPREKQSKKRQLGPLDQAKVDYNGEMRNGEANGSMDGGRDAKRNKKKA